jgi:hypothetical protein
MTIPYVIGIRELGPNVPLASRPMWSILCITLAEVPILRSRFGSFPVEYNAVIAEQS